MQAEAKHTDAERILRSTTEHDLAAFNRARLRKQRRRAILGSSEIPFYIIGILFAVSVGFYADSLKLGALVISAIAMFRACSLIVAKDLGNRRPLKIEVNQSVSQKEEVG